MKSISPSARGFKLSGKMAPFRPTQPPPPPPKGPTGLAVTVAILLVLVVVFGAARMFFSPAYPEVEYRMPGFPDDFYGFDQDDRLRWAAEPLKFLREGLPPSYLQALHFNGSDGGDQGERVFQDEEIHHLEDVQVVFTGMMVLWTAAVLVLASLIAGASRSSRIDLRNAMRRGIRAGAWSIVGLLGFLLVAGVIAFAGLFETFHEVLFPQGNWQFSQSDTLIRLYPLRFWSDALIGIALTSLTTAGLLLWRVKKVRA